MKGTVPLLRRVPVFLVALWSLAGPLAPAILPSLPGLSAAGRLAASPLVPLVPQLAVQVQDPVAARVDAWAARNQHALMREFVELLSIPNVAADAANIRRNAERLAAMLRARGVEARLLETGGPPFVFGERTVPGATRTLLIYGHYDGQPVDASRWTGTEPWTPALRTASIEEGGVLRPFPAPPEEYEPGWRIYARSASDDKGGIFAALAALSALDGIGERPTVTLKFIFEGDEEAGSAHMAGIVERHAQLLAADAAIIVDGPVHPSGLPTVYYGVRGIVSVQITVYGPIRPLHSGHYGNWAPNPAMRLAQLLASMKDPRTGRVLVPGWYDDVVPLGAAERAALAEIPQDDAELARTFGFGEAEGGGASLLELINLPSLNVRGLRSAWVGEEARTIVPSEAVAELDLRLVKDVRPDAQVRRLVAHIEGQGYHVVRDEPDRETRRRHARVARVRTAEGGGYPAMRTSMDLPISKDVAAAVARATGERVVRLPTLGGSAPLHFFSDRLGMPTMGVPIVNHDNNQHSPNENVRIGHLLRGIRILAGLMTL